MRCEYPDYIHDEYDNGAISEYFEELRDGKGFYKITFCPVTISTHKVTCYCSELCSELTIAQIKFKGRSIRGFIVLRENGPEFMPMQHGELFRS